MKLSLHDYQSSAGIIKWVEALGVADAPIKRQGIETSLQFFATRMTRLSVELASDFLRAIDLSRPVRSIPLVVDERIIAFRQMGEAEFKLFYTRPGASMHASGINPMGRMAVHYRVRTACWALESYTTGAIDTWSVPSNAAIAPRKPTYGHMAYGGGIQLIIPEAHRSLDLVPVS